MRIRAPLRSAAICKPGHPFDTLSGRAIRGSLSTSAAQLVAPAARARIWDSAAAIASDELAAV
jgi:hypothetical protein